MIYLSRKSIPSRVSLNKCQKRGFIFFYSLESLDLIDGKIKQAEAAKLDLENNKINLEQEIRLKEFSLELDQSKCLTMRQNFPFTTKCGLATKFNSIDRRRFRVNMKM